MTRPTQITIDLAALKHNYSRVNYFAQKSAVIAMVKSNAYGHGLARIGMALPNANALGVACLEEGILLRESGAKNAIVLMEGLFQGSELQKAINNDFTTVIHHLDQVDMLESELKASPIKVWLKINTGMNRLGFNPGDVVAIYQRLMQCSAVVKPFGLMTHFAESDASDKAPTFHQIETFKKVTHNLSGPHSLANSAGILEWPEAHADWVRPGIMLYGASPFPDRTGAEHGLLPVMTLSSKLIAIHQVNRGERIGYGGTWTCPEDMHIGVVAIGYGDGYPRHAENGTPILVNGKICPLVGRVSMDMITVDLRSQPFAKVNDPVVLWGKDLPVEVVASHSDTTGYELLTRITQRVRVIEG